MVGPNHKFAQVPTSVSIRPASVEASAKWVAEDRYEIRPGTRLMEVVRGLDAAGVDALDVHLREATLDDVFLTLTENDSAKEAA